LKKLKQVARVRHLCLGKSGENGKKGVLFWVWLGNTKPRKKKEGKIQVDKSKDLPPREII